MSLTRGSNPPITSQEIQFRLFANKHFWQKDRYNNIHLKLEQQKSRWVKRLENKKEERNGSTWTETNNLCNRLVFSCLTGVSFSFDSIHTQLSMHFLSWKGKDSWKSVSRFECMNKAFILCVLSYSLCSLCVVCVLTGTTIFCWWRRGDSIPAFLSLKEVDKELEVCSRKRQDKDLRECSFKGLSCSVWTL